MTKRELAALACRIVALVVWVHSISYATFIIGVLTTAEGSAESWWEDVTSQVRADTLVCLGVLIGSGLFLWLRASWLARAMVSEGPASLPGCKTTIQDGQAVGFSIIGMYLLVTAITQLTYGLCSHYFRASDIPEGIHGFEMTAHVRSSITTAAIRGILGAVLLFQARGLAGLLKIVRTAGLKEQQEQEEKET